MIRPNKYTNVELSVIGVGAEILSQLNKEPSQKYSSLQNKVVYRLGEASKQSFLLALVLLFSLGKIRYYKQEDAIEYLQTEKQK